MGSSWPIPYLCHLAMSASSTLYPTFCGPADAPAAFSALRKLSASWRLNFASWAGTVVIHPKAKTGAHHHGPVESVIYVVSGRARMRWGDKLEFVAEAGPGDFIYVPPYVPHQEINASDDQPLSCVLVRSGQEPVVVNLDIPVVEKPEEVHWVDNIHAGPTK